MHKIRIRMPIRCQIDRQHGPIDARYGPRSRRTCLAQRLAQACVARRRKQARVPPMFEARFQSFDDSHERAAAAAHLEGLRAELKRCGLDGFVVPRADRQQNEYLPASEERLAWLTGFTGSAGAAIVLAERAAVFVDGRYTVQAAAQIDAKTFLHRASGGRPAGAVARTQSHKRRQARLRSVAAYHRERGETAQGLRHGRRRTGGGRGQSDRCVVERPPGAAGGPSDAA